MTRDEDRVAALLLALQSIAGHRGAPAADGRAAWEIADEALARDLPWRQAEPVVHMSVRTPESRGHEASFACGPAAGVLTARGTLNSSKVTCSACLAAMSTWRG